MCDVGYLYVNLSVAGCICYRVIPDVRDTQRLSEYTHMLMLL